MNYCKDCKWSFIGEFTYDLYCKNPKINRTDPVDGEVAYSRCDVQRESFTIIAALFRNSCGSGGVAFECKDLNDGN